MSWDESNEINDMRDWAKDCNWREAEDNCLTGEEYVDDLTDAQVRAGVERNYSGGTAGFRQDMRYGD